MKSYLDLVPLFGKVHRRQNRMTIFCIILSVFLITGIFSMADLFIQSQILQAQKDDGNWHMAVRGITDEQVELIQARPDVRYATRYGVRNYHADLDYTLGGKNVIVCGCDEPWMTIIQKGMQLQGRFPQTATEALVTQNAQKQLGLQIGSTITVQTPDNRQCSFTVSGFTSDEANMLKYDSFAVIITTEAMRQGFFPEQSSHNLEDYNSLLYIQFADTFRLQQSMQEIQTAFGLADEQITENLKLTGLLGQSGSALMLSIYSTAGVLVLLVMLAGTLMIAGSLNSSVAQKIEFYGMIRCIGATPKQVTKLVRREALSWCRLAIPAGVLIGLGMVWVLCAVLRFLSPDYFQELPAFGVSVPGVVAGVVVGIATVFLAAHRPAKRASRVSPLAAVSGNATTNQPVRKAANTRFCPIETALGIHHATASRQNFLLITSSFALSIVLFLAFSVTIAFMHHALTPLQPWAPDLSIISRDNSLSVSAELLPTIEQNPAVKRVFGRQFADTLPATVSDKAASAATQEATGEAQKIDLMSYEAHQWDWAKQYLIRDTENAISTVQERHLTGVAVYNHKQETQLQTGDVVSLLVDEQSAELQIVGTLSQCPFDSTEGSIIVIVSEETFRQITGQQDYTIIDIQLQRNASEADVEAIQQLADGYTFSDRRMGNRSVQGAYYSFSLCIYGFLVLIALIAICNIINSIALSVAAKTKQYGVFRAIGLSHAQFARMVIAEAAIYAVSGSVAGLAIGLVCHRYLFQTLIANNWGNPWGIPWGELSIIVGLVLLSVAIAVQAPIRRLQALSIVDNIHAE